MILNAENIRDLNRSFRVLSMAALDAVPARWNQIAMEVPSGTSSNDYGWLTEIPGAREWIGERNVKNLSSAGYNIKNRDFELTVGVKRKDIEDDNIGIYSPMFQSLGESFAYSPDELVFDLLKRGFTENAYDGKPFFDATHKIGKTTYSNLSNKILTSVSLNDAITKMQSLKRETGQPIRVFFGEGASAPLLVVGPANRANARALIGIADLPGGGTNPDYGTARVLVLPEITGPEWMLLDTSKVIKPLILQMRKKPQFVAMDAPTDEATFMKGELRYGFDDRKNAGFAFWQLAYGSVGTTA
jgi:phage major head subunit gpT-like protein